MATTIEQLLVEIRLQGAEPTKKQLREIRDEVGKIESGFQMLSTLGGALVLLSNLREMLSVFSEISGLKIAAQFTGIALSLETVTGSAEKANKLLRELKQLGKETPFDTAELSGFAARMIGAGVATEKVVGELTKLADIAAFGGISRADLPVFLRNLLQIRGRGTGKADMADINELKDRVPAISRILAAGIGGNLTPEDALKKAGGMKGRELYDTILKGGEALAKGAAAARALRDPVAALANLFETLKMIMEPTGQIIIKLLSPVLRIVQELANFLQKLNEVTGGVVGLASLIGGAMWLATRTATAALWDFVRVMLATTGAARTASVSTAGTAATGWAAAGAGFAGMIAGLKSVGAGIAAVATRFLPWIAAAAAIGDTFDQMSTNLGYADELIDRAKNKGILKDKTGNPVVDELKKANRTLEDIKSRNIGAGPRTAAGIAHFEAEFQISKAFGLA